MGYMKIAASARGQQKNKSIIQIKKVLITNSFFSFDERLFGKFNVIIYCWSYKIIKSLYLSSNQKVEIIQMHKIDKLIRSKRRTLSLEINESAEVIVRAPLKMPKEIIERFIYEKRIWIDEKLNVLQAKQKEETKFEQGESFLYLGVNYKLDITDTVFNFFNGEKFSLSIRDKNSAEKIFKKWYKERAKIVITERVDYFSKYMQLEYKNIKITSAAKRWGSCSGYNNLNFTWRLIMAPMNIIDYVVVHELAHIRQKNHSKKFWAIVEKYIPDYKLKRKWLRENGYRLKL